MRPEELPSVECKYEQPPLPVEGELSVGPTDNPALVKEARQLVGNVYVKRGFITSDQLDEDGVMTDEHDPDFSHSRYYVALNAEGRVVATSRLIQYDSRLGRESFPLVREHLSELDDGMVAGIESSFGWEGIVEISNLARDKDADPKGHTAMQLYRSMMSDGWRGGDSQVYIMASNPRLDKNFERLFGGALKRLGPSLDYPGQPAEPTMLDSLSGLIHVIESSRDEKNPYRRLHEEIIRFFLDGVHSDQVDKTVEEALVRGGYDDILETMRGADGNGLDVEESLARIRRLGIHGAIREKAQKYKPELIGGGLLLGYTAARTAAVALGVSPTTDVEWETFLAVEVATTPPYVWAAGDIIRNIDAEGEKRPSRARKLGAYATYYGTLAAPYVYVVAEGGTTTTPSLVTTAGMFALPLVAKYAKKPVSKVIRHMKAKKPALENNDRVE